MIRKPKPGVVVRAILLGALVAGTLDILDAILFYGLRNHIAPIRILQSVASGLLGRAAFRGGWHTALIGLGLHFLIAAIWAKLFVLASLQLPILRREAVRSGLFYGLLIYAVMNYLVLPHTHAAPMGRQPLVLINGVLAIVFLVGLPISLINRNATS